MTMDTTALSHQMFDQLFRQNKRQLFIVAFSYVRDEDVRTVLSSTSSLAKRPLYVLLDGTWTEARKMFRKSPYLDKFPVISVQPETLSAYRLRVAAHDNHLCTAEVATCLLQQQGDLVASETLQQWFMIFRERYLKMKPHHNKPERLMSYT